jgi:thiosulfate reductase/polysulfide reductase chain A
MELSRREFLKGAGSAAAGGLILGPSLLDRESKAFAQGSQAADPIVWEEILYQSCGVCDNTCGLLAYVKDGHIKWIEGNPADTLGGAGKACIKGVSAMRNLYDPDRLKWPLKRTNPNKGKNEDPGWVKISWEEAFSTIAERFNESMANYGPESILLIARPKDQDTRLQKAIGTPNQVCHVDTCYITHEVAWMAMVTNGGRSWTMDLENAKYLLIFGWDQPGKSMQSHERGYFQALEKGAKAVVFDPRMSLTASKADEWIPIRPGTDLAVVLAMMNVIISEGLHDEEYIAEYTTGFDKLAEHVKQYTPEWASQLSDVPADDIVRIAREFATTKPAIIPTHKRDAGGPLYANGFSMAQAEIIMCALVGSIEKPGGYYLDRKPKVRSMDEFAPVTYPEMKEKRRVDGQHLFPLANKKRKGAFAHLAQGILSGEPYKVRVGLAKGYNVLSFPNPDTIIEAIKTLDFLVAVDILPNEMCQLADIVLPDVQFLEKGGIEIREYHALWPQIMLRQGTGALWEEKGWGSIVNGILEAMGKPEFKVDWDGLEEAKLQDAGTSMEYLESNNGIWEDKKDPVSKKEFSTPTKKIELYSTVLKKEGHEPLPVWHERLTTPTTEYPYYILTNHLPWQRMGRTSNDPILTEIQPENFVHMHPDTAAEIGAKESEYVIVDSPTGNSLKIRAHLTRGIRRDCVMTEHGFGYWSKALQVAYGRGTCDGDLLPERRIDDTLKTYAYNAAMSNSILDVCVSLRKA